MITQSLYLSVDLRTNQCEYTCVWVGVGRRLLHQGKHDVVELFLDQVYDVVALVHDFEEVEVGRCFGHLDDGDRLQAQLDGIVDVFREQHFEHLFQELRDVRGFVWG